MVSSVDRENIAIIIERMFSYDEKLARVLELVRKFTEAELFIFPLKKWRNQSLGFYRITGSIVSIIITVEWSRNKGCSFSSNSFPAS